MCKEEHIGHLSSHNVLHNFLMLAGTYNLLDLRRENASLVHTKTYTNACTERNFLLEILYQQIQTLKNKMELCNKC